MLIAFQKFDGSNKTEKEKKKLDFSNYFKVDIDMVKTDLVEPNRLFCNLFCNLLVVPLSTVKNRCVTEYLYRNNLRFRNSQVMRRNPLVWNWFPGRRVRYSSAAKLSFEHHLSEHG